MADAVIEAREITLKIGASVIAVAEAFTVPKVTAKPKEVAPIESSLMQEVAQCVLTAEQGEKVIPAGDSSKLKSQRNIVVFGEGGNMYNVSLTKTYPNPYIEDNLLTVQPYLEITGIQNGRQIMYIMEGESGGKVSYAEYPEDQKAITTIIKNNDRTKVDSLLSKRFKEKWHIYQKGFRKTMLDIVKACRGNR